MESIDFKKILLRTSFGVMACDGHVHPAEIDELKTISTGTKYLEGIDIDSELKNITAEFNGQKRTFFQENFKQLADAGLSDSDKLIVIDVVLRMIAADDRVDENEAKFSMIGAIESMGQNTKNNEEVMLIDQGGTSTEISFASYKKTEKILVFISIVCVSPYCYKYNTTYNI